MSSRHSRRSNAQLSNHLYPKMMRALNRLHDSRTILPQTDRCQRRLLPTQNHDSVEYEMTPEDETVVEVETRRGAPEEALGDHHQVDASSSSTGGRNVFIVDQNITLGMTVQISTT